MNADFCKMRNVRSTLWKQPNIRHLHDRLKTQGILLDFDDSASSAERPPKLLEDVSSSSEEEEF
jgi:hypothetical protein